MDVVKEEREVWFFRASRLKSKGKEDLERERAVLVEVERRLL